MSNPEEFMQISLKDHEIVERLKKRIDECNTAIGMLLSEGFDENDEDIQFRIIRLELQKILGEEK